MLCQDWWKLAIWIKSALRFAKLDKSQRLEARRAYNSAQHQTGCRRLQGSLLGLASSFQSFVRALAWIQAAARWTSENPRRMENMFRLSNGQATTKRLKTDSEEYKVCANECLTLHLIKPALQGSTWPPKAAFSFKPEFTHQIFGDDEQIIGYKGLAINIYFSQRDFRACADVTFTDKAHGAIDILATLKKHFPAGLTADKQQFLSDLSNTSIVVKSLGRELPVPGLTSKLAVVQVTLAQSNDTLKVNFLFLRLLFQL